MRRLNAFFIALLLFALPAFAADTLTFEDAFIRETPMKISAGYVTITNQAPQDDVLKSATAAWAGKIELHDVKVNESGVLEMLPMGSLPIKQGDTAALHPGGRHLMIYDLKEKLTAGDTKAITLVFEKAGEIKVDFAVMPITYRGKKIDAGQDPAAASDPHAHDHH